MNDSRYIYTSLTRIADLESGFQLRKIDRRSWDNGDYVVCRITRIGGSTVKAELNNGRMMTIMEGDLMVGALGIRHATLEATGSWKAVGKDGKMHILTGAGLVGKLTSRSRFVTPLIEIKYLGHVFQKGEKRNMLDYAGTWYAERLNLPVVLVVGTSMSSGKTTSARIVTRSLKHMGLKVAGAKLTGAGRFRDILTIADAGADFICDFVDAGLPSSICDSATFKTALFNMLGRIVHAAPDVAVIEIGASPLEPYNGDLAIQAIQKDVICSILCANDPYAVLGVMHSFDFKPTIVSGPAVNTTAGCELIDKLCGVKALNLIDARNQPAIDLVLRKALSPASPHNGTR